MVGADAGKAFRFRPDGNLAGRYLADVRRSLALALLRACADGGVNLNRLLEHRRGDLEAIEHRDSVGDAIRLQAPYLSHPERAHIFSQEVSALVDAL